MPNQSKLRFMEDLARLMIRVACPFSAQIFRPTVKA
jgi:hypothetical protein